MSQRSVHEMQTGLTNQTLGKYKIILFIICGIIIGILNLVLSFKINVFFFLGVILFLIIMASPHTGMLLTIGTLIFGYTTAMFPREFPISMSVQKLIGLLTLISWIVHKLLKKSKIIAFKDIFISQNIMLLGYVLTILITLFLNNNDDGIRRLNHIIALVIFYFLITQMIDSEEFFRKAIGIFVITSIIIACFSIVQPFLFQSRSEFDISSIGPFLDPSEQGSTGILYRTSGLYHADVIGMLMVMTIPLILFFIQIRKSALFKIVLIFALIVILASIVLTYSRSAVLSLIAITPFLIFRRLVKISPALIIISLLIVFSSYLIAPRAFLNRVFSIENLRESQGLDVRKKLWSGAWEMFKDNWFTGVGLAGFEVNSYKYVNIDQGKEREEYKTPMTTHNLYLEAASEQGVFGLVFLLSFFGFSIIGFRKVRKKFKIINNPEMSLLSSALELCLIAFLIFNIAHSSLIHNKEIWFILACAIVLRKIYIQQENKIMNNKVL